MKICLPEGSSCYSFGSKKVSNPLTCPKTLFACSLQAGNYKPGIWNLRLNEYGNLSRFQYYYFLLLINISNI